MSRKPLTDKDGEIRTLNAEDFKSARKLKEAHPEIVQTFKRGPGRPPIESPKQEVKIRLDADVFAWLKAGGRGYQTRLNAILREAMGK